MVVNATKGAVVLTFESTRRDIRELLREVLREERRDLLRDLRPEIRAMAREEVIGFYAQLLRESVPALEKMVVDEVATTVSPRLALLELRHTVAEIVRQDAIVDAVREELILCLGVLAKRAGLSVDEYVLGLAQRENEG